MPLQDYQSKGKIPLSRANEQMSLAERIVNLFLNEGDQKNPEKSASNERKLDYKKENCFEYYSLMRDYVKHEDSLIGVRINWSLTVQGFLYTAYGFTFQKLLEFEQGQAKNLAKVEWNSFLSLKIFLFILVLAGLWSSISGLIGIVVTRNVIEKLVQTYNSTIVNTQESTNHESTQTDCFMLPPLAGGGLGEKATRAGNYPLDILLLSFIVWSFLFIVLFINTVFETSIPAPNTSTQNSVNSLKNDVLSLRKDVKGLQNRISQLQKSIDKLNKGLSKKP